MTPGRLQPKRLCHLREKFLQARALGIEGQQFLAHHGRIKGASRHQLDQIIHSDQWQPVRGSTGYCRQLSLHQIAYQIHQRLAVRDMPRAAMTANRGGVYNGHLSTLGIHEAEGREMRLQFARLVSTDLAIDRSEEHTSELQSPCNLVCRLLLEKKKRASSQICRQP